MHLIPIRWYAKQHITTALLAFAQVAVSHALAATFTPLGFLPDGYYYSEAFDVAADGRVVVGEAHHGGLGNEAFRWTPETGMVGLGDIPTGAFQSQALAVSDNGGIVVGAGT